MHGNFLPWRGRLQTALTVAIFAIPQKPHSLRDWSRRPLALPSNSARQQQPEINDGARQQEPIDNVKRLHQNAPNRCPVAPAKETIGHRAIGCCLRSTCRMRPSPENMTTKPANLELVSSISRMGLFRCHSLRHVFEHRHIRSFVNRNWFGHGCERSAARSFY
jgi:hypothetical protein